MLGALAIAASWTFAPSTVLYLVGLALIVAGLVLFAVRHRIAWIAAPAVAVILGIAVPWALIHSAYSVPGEAVAGVSPDTRAEFFPITDGLFGVVQAGMLRAVDAKAAEQWMWEGDVAATQGFSVLPGDRLLVSERVVDDVTELVLDAQTGDVVSAPTVHPDADTRVIAADDSGFVLARCPRSADEDQDAPRLCTYSHIADDGSSSWEVEAREAYARPAVPDLFTDFSPSTSVATAFTTFDAEGRIQVRAAASGQTVVSTDEGDHVVLAEPDRAVVFHGDAASADTTCTIEVYTIDATGENTRIGRETPCDLLAGEGTPILASGETLSWEQGLAGTGPDDDVQVILNTGDATTRVHEGALSWWGGNGDIIGSGVVVQSRDGRMTVLDARTGEELWTTGVAADSQVNAKGGLVWTVRTGTTLPMQELFGYSVTGSAVEAFDARSGERIAATRLAGAGWGVAAGHLFARDAMHETWMLMGAPEE